MSAAKFFNESLTSPVLLTDRQRQNNVLKGLAALADQLDRIENRQRHLESQVQQLEAIVRGLR